MKNFLFKNFFCETYDLSLFISVRAFLPSLRVLKTSQDNDETIRVVSVIKEIKVVSMLFNFPSFL